MAQETGLTQVSDIGFPEFTAKLVTDVFDALISANLLQMEAYAELVSQLSKDLSVFINTTKDDITGDMVLDVLEKLLPNGEGGTKATKNSSEKITTEEAAELNDKLSTIDEDDQQVRPIEFVGDTEIKDVFEQLLDAVRIRLAANKYAALEKMAQMGMLRLVVENGLIETKLFFSARTYESDSSKATQYTKKKTSAGARVGGFMSFVAGGASARKSTLKVTTGEQKSYSSNSTYGNIMGKVQLNFKTDYMPLNTKDA